MAEEPQARIEDAKPGACVYIVASRIKGNEERFTEGFESVEKGQEVVGGSKIEGGLLWNYGRCRG
jgi:hypothetical protein